MYNTNPCSDDSDGDGISDWDEVMCYATNPLQIDEDKDGDGIPDSHDVDPQHKTTYNKPGIVVFQIFNQEEKVLVDTNKKYGVSPVENIKVYAVFDPDVNSHKYEVTINYKSIINADPGDRRYYCDMNSLANGLHRILVKVTLDDGQIAVFRKHVLIDSKGPEILSFIAPDNVSGSKVSLENIFVKAQLSEHAPYYDILVNGQICSKQNFVSIGQYIYGWVKITNLTAENPNNEILLKVWDAYHAVHSKSVTVSFDPQSIGGFPYDSANDYDLDGVTNAMDLYPEDPEESSDSDCDGVGDNRDPDPADSRICKGLNIFSLDYNNEISTNDSNYGRCIELFTDADGDATSKSMVFNINGVATDNSKQVKIAVYYQNAYDSCTEGNINRVYYATVNQSRFSVDVQYFPGINKVYVASNTEYKMFTVRHNILPCYYEMKRAQKVITPKEYIAGEIVNSSYMDFAPAIHYEYASYLFGAPIVNSVDLYSLRINNSIKKGIIVDYTFPFPYLSFNNHTSDAPGGYAIEDGDENTGIGRLGLMGQGAWLEEIWTMSSGYVTKGCSHDKQTIHNITYNGDAGNDNSIFLKPQEAVRFVATGEIESYSMREKKSDVLIGYGAPLYFNNIFCSAKAISRQLEWDYINIGDENNPRMVPSQKINLYVYDIDLDADSDNSQFLSGSDGTLYSWSNDIEDDIIEDITLPGKLIAVNDDDIDGDNIPDFADGYSLPLNDQRPDDENKNSCYGTQFIPITINIPLIDAKYTKDDKTLASHQCGMLQSASIRFEYDASDPQNVKYNDIKQSYMLPDQGSLRIWTNSPYHYKRDGRALGSQDTYDPITLISKDEDGRELSQYIASGVDYSIFMLPFSRVCPYTEGDTGYAVGSETVTLYVEALKPGTQRIKVTLIPHTFVNEDGDTITPAEGFCVSDEILVTAIGVNIGVDGNRDGMIDFENQADYLRPEYLFWYNNDDDHQWLSILTDQMYEEDDTISNGELGDIIPHYFRADWDIVNSRDIDCKRDLEDFARLHLYTGCNRSSFKPGEIEYTMKLTSSESGGYINIFKACEKDGGMKYLEQNEYAENQMNENILFCNKTPQFIMHPYSVGPQEEKLTNYITDMKHTYFIFEGSGYDPKTYDMYIATNAQILPDRNCELVYQIKYKGHMIAEKKMKMNLRDSSTFYDKYSSEGSTRLSSYNPQSNDYLLFVHGWNMGDEDTERWGATIFKRLWWKGYMGRVGVFRWPTKQGAFTYNTSDEIAWNNGQILLNTLSSINVQENGRYANQVRVLAHSMGNVVAGEAIRLMPDNQKLIHTYVATQAAIPASIYGENMNPISQKWDWKTPDIFGHYYSGDSQTRPVFKNNLAKLSNKAYNYYNWEDYALMTGRLPIFGVEVNWVANNRKYKPDRNCYYTYDISSYNQAEDTFFYAREKELILYGFEEDNYHLFAFFVQSRSYPLGTSECEGFEGYDLKKHNGYNNAWYYHSHQFRSNIIDTKTYWDQIIHHCQLQINE